MSALDKIMSSISSTVGNLAADVPSYNLGNTVGTIANGIANQASPSSSSIADIASQIGQQVAMPIEENRKLYSQQVPIVNTAYSSPIAQSKVDFPIQFQKQEAGRNKIASADLVGSIADAMNSMIGSEPAVTSGKPIDKSSSSIPLEERLGIVKHDDDVENRLNPSVTRLLDEKDEDDIRRAFEAEQAKRLDRAKEGARNQLYAQAALSGADPYTDPYLKQRLDNINDLEYVPRAQAEFERRFTDGNGNVIRNPLKWNLFGVTSQTKTPTAARDLYDYNFNKEDKAGIRNTDTVSSKFTSRDSLGRVVDRNMIDDGADPASRESLYMTGDQYYKYRTQFGIPGRDVDQIDRSPNVIYNKQDEQDEYGFIPYIKGSGSLFLGSKDSLNKFHDQAAAPFVSNIFNNVADARRKLTDYKINYDGQQYSGKDFDKNMRLWDKRTAGAHPKTVYSIDEADEYAIPQTLVMYAGDGSKYVAPNKPISAEKMNDGSIVIRFNDNPADDWVFDDQADYDKSLKQEPAKDGEYVYSWLNQEPVVLDSGQKIRADKAVDLWQNYDNYVDYGPGNIFKPNVSEPFKEKAFAPWFIDLALSSSPYFNNITAGAQAGADALNNLSGMKPGYQDYLNGTYQLLSENPTREEQISSSLGSFTMPMIERLWGPLGNYMFKVGPTRRLLNTLHVPERILDHPIGRLGTGSSDEGVEEILGNINEEFQQNGLDWYSNDKMLYDEDGNPVLNYRGEPVSDVDSQGTAAKENSGFRTRMANFIKDAPLAYLGGASLGGILGTARLPEYYRDRNETRRLGYKAQDVPIDLDALMRTQAISDAERNYYDSLGYDVASSPLAALGIPFDVNELERLER